MSDDLYNTIRSHIDNFETQLFTSLPATVISIDHEQQTITAQPVMLEPYTDGDISEFPSIDHVPIIFPSAGGGSLTFPVKAGDEVLLVFSARSYDTWWNTSQTLQLSSTQRYHNITDAIAIVGLTSKPNSVNPHPEDVELKFGKNFIKLKADDSIEIHAEKNLIKLPNDGTVEIHTDSTLKVTNNQEELVSLLSDALQLMSEITVNTIYGISPVNNKIQIQQLKTRLDTFKS